MTRKDYNHHPGGDVEVGMNIVKGWLADMLVAPEADDTMSGRLLHFEYEIRAMLGDDRRSE